jgi:hypothetical protein
MDRIKERKRLDMMIVEELDKRSLGMAAFGGNNACMDFMDQRRTSEMRDKDPRSLGGRKVNIR